MENLEVKIRKYQPEDRQAVREICADTGYLGQPIDKFFQDRELFADIITSYYTDKEPCSAWVVEDQNKVVGYLTGTLNGKKADFHRALNTIKNFPSLIKKYLKYSPQSKKFIRKLLFKFPFEIPKTPSGATCHINLLPKYQSRGLGIQLAQTFTQYLQEKGAKTIYGLYFDDGNKEKSRNFIEFGFQEYSRKKTSLFDKDLYLVTLVKKLE